MGLKNPPVFLNLKGYVWRRINVMQNDYLAITQPMTCTTSKHDSNITKVDSNYSNPKTDKN